MSRRQPVWVWLVVCGGLLMGAAGLSVAAFLVWKFAPPISRPKGQPVEQVVPLAAQPQNNAPEVGGKQKPSSLSKEHFEAACMGLTLAQVEERFGPPDEFTDDAKLGGWDAEAATYRGPFKDQRGRSFLIATLYFKRAANGSVTVRDVQFNPILNAP